MRGLLKQLARFAGLAALGLAGLSIANEPEQKKAQPPRPPLPAAAALSAKSAILIDEKTGQVLWAKDADTKRFPASTTKIMTALLLIERCQPDEMVTAPIDIDKVGESSLHLKPGEQLTVKELLWGLLLRSANDGCVAAADHVSGSVEAFCKLMNERAAQLGCTNTHFDNPNGLNDPLHVTTAHDLALIAREAMKYPEFREVVRNRKHTIERSINTADRFIVSKNKFLAVDPTADGIKTGFTRPAGQCFVGSASRRGYRLISVVLGSEDWLGDTRRLIDWGFASFEVTRPAQAGQVLKEQAHVQGGKPIDAAPVRSARCLIKKESVAIPQVTTTFFQDLRAPVAIGQPVGVLTVTDGAGWTDRIPLVAMQAVTNPEGRRPSAVYYVGGLGLVGMWMASRRQRRRFYGRFK